MTQSMKKKIQRILRGTGTARDTNASKSNKMIFQLSNEGFLDNGRTLLEERVSLFHGKTNHIRCLSVNDLNTHFKDWIPYNESWTVFQYQCVWERRPVLVKFCKVNGLTHMFFEECCREIAIATEMGIHKYVHKLLACCLETETPVLIYEYAENGALVNRIHEEKNQTKAPLDWKNRLRIAYEVSHAVAYLHTAFPRPIIHRDIKPENVMLGENNTAKLTDFSFCLSIPEGKTSVEPDKLKGTFGYMAPEFARYGRLVEKSDVYSFGVLFLEILTGQKSRNWISSIYDPNNVKDSSDIVPKYYNTSPSWPYVPNDMIVRKLIADNTSKLIDAYLEASDAPNEDLFHKQVWESTELGLRCITEEEDIRPTMEEVATQLKNIITYSSSCIPTTST